MSETRKIAEILVAEIAGYSRLAGADEDRTLSRLRGLRSDLIGDQAMLLAAISQSLRGNMELGTKSGRVKSTLTNFPP
jgi:hypothetical protein